MQPSIRATPLVKTGASVDFVRRREFGTVTALAAVVLAALLSATASEARAQKVPTATQQLHISVFGGLTGRETKFGRGRNGDITAGLDLGLIPYRFLRPSIEVRGSYDVKAGRVDGQKDILGGVKLETKYQMLHPYVDVLFGRAGITYAGKGAQVPGTGIFYTSSSTNAISAGGGLDYDLTRHFALKADSQLLRLSTPVTPGHIHPYEVTVGVTYRIGGGWLHPKRGKAR